VTSRPPALVEPGPPLSPEQLQRYSRQLLLPGFGDDAQRRLANARVLVIGAGGLGSASVPYLASAGVGTIGIIDSDVVELSNLHRQVAHGLADVGRSKIDSLAESIAEIDPQVDVHRHPGRFTSETALELLAGYDLLLDGSDNFPTRYLANDAAALAGIPLVWGAILRYSGQVGVAWAEHGPTYRDLFPVPPAPDGVLSCSVGGVLPSVAATIGALMATEALKVITGIGELLIGRVTVMDALTGQFREVAYERTPEAGAITGLIDYEQFCGVSRAHAGEPALVMVAELSRRLSAGEAVQLIDVREPFEAEIARIPQAELIPLGQLEASLALISPDSPVVVYCHHDTRSRRAARILRNNGVSRVEVLEGGIDAWASVVDPSLPRY
jgi:molybdopterin/thiamine biosynthesis adenylyltransferase/rhodanese-related sulfurtransferase